MLFYSNEFLNDTAVIYNDQLAYSLEIVTAMKSCAESRTISLKLLKSM